jgi:enoyl-CoA hydratase/carnithine racemase
VTSEILGYSVRDRIATIRLNRPESLNALDPPLVAALIDAMQRVRRDDAVRCGLLLGTGRAFSAGGDLKAMLKMGRDEFREYIVLLQRLSGEMRRVAKPLIAAIHGYALAGGLELAANCDIRMAAEDAKFGLPDTPVGLSPTSGLTFALPRIVGMGWAKYLAFTGETIDAAHAERIGLVTHVVPLGRLEEAAHAMARRIVEHPPAALRHIKLGFDLAADAGLETALTYETDAEVACFDTEEVGANLRAFADRKHSRKRNGGTA